MYGQTIDCMILVINFKMWHMECIYATYDFGFRIRCFRNEYLDVVPWALFIELYYLTRITEWLINCASYIGGQNWFVRFSLYCGYLRPVAIFYSLYTFPQSFAQSLVFIGSFVKILLAFSWIHCVEFLHKNIRSANCSTNKLSVSNNISKLCQVTSWIKEP